MTKLESHPLLSTKVVATDGTPSEIVDLSQTMHISIQPELFRFYAYLFFWSMVVLAIFVTEFVTADYLLRGVDDGEPLCPPFERFDGKGFDIHTESHLMESFGFNNICINFDYSPSREVAALIYPVFEYTLLLYIVTDFVMVALAYKKGIVSSRYWTVMKYLFPLMIILCSWFRMVFVLPAYESMRGHTAGFLGLQLVLMMVACLNVWYIVETKVEYSFLRGRRGTQICGWVYLLLDLTVGLLKFGLDAHLVLGYGYPSWGLVLAFGGNGMVVGQIVDIIWMVFNVIVPLIVSYIRSQFEQPLEITIDMQPPKYVLRQLEKEGNVVDTIQ